MSLIVKRSSVCRCIHVLQRRIEFLVCSAKLKIRVASGLFLQAPSRRKLSVFTGKIRQSIDHDGCTSIM